MLIQGFLKLFLCVRLSKSELLNNLNDKLDHLLEKQPVSTKEKSLSEIYMMDSKLTEPSQGAWSSPCLLVPKPDGTFRFQKVNSLTKGDSYPLPRIEDYIDRVGNSKYVTKFDLLKGCWQFPLTERKFLHL